MNLPRLRGWSCFAFTCLLAACGSDDSADGGDSQASDTQAEGDGDGDPTGGDGDGDGDPSGDGDGDALRPNWHQDIAPLVYANCVGCHFDGGIAPFTLETYTDAAAWAGLMNDAVAAEVMPPWGALETDECQPTHSWRNDLRLTSEQKQMFADWVEAGVPEGDPADAVALPEPPSLELQAPSVILQNPAPTVVGGTEDSFLCVVVDPELTEDVWVTGVQMIPDNPEVVHHVLIYSDPDNAAADLVDENGTYPCQGFVSLPGTMQIGTWVPGAVPTELPEDVGVPMPAGSKVILAYHYHPTGAGDEVDQSSVALRWTSDKPPLNAVFGLFGNGDGLEPGPNDPGGSPIFYIPPDVSDHIETHSFPLPDILPPTQVFSLGTHMHYVGVDMRIWLERDGEDICLLQTPRWDFNWQRNYDVDATLGNFPTVQGGDVLKIQCRYDNTLNNPFLVGALAEQGLSEPIPVGLGEASLDEMCLMLFGVATNLDPSLF